MAGFRFFGARAKIGKAKIIGAKREIDLEKKKNPLKKLHPKNTTSISSKVVNGEVDHRDTPARHFTEFCALCKKNIKGENAFMYGYLQAFCSPDCRDIQIALDNNENVNPSSAKTNGNDGGPPAQIEAKAKLVLPTPHHITETAGAISEPPAASRPNKPQPSRVACCAAFFP